MGSGGVWGRYAGCRDSDAAAVDSRASSVDQRGLHGPASVAGMPEAPAGYGLRPHRPVARSGRARQPLRDAAGPAGPGGFRQFHAAVWEAPRAAGGARPFPDLWLRFYPRQTMAVLIDRLESTFARVGGVPQELLFNQIRAVVLPDDRAASGGLMPNDEFPRFAAHWRFMPHSGRPCRARIGRHEVEAFLTDVAKTAAPVEMYFLRRPQLRDPADEMVLETAVNAEATAIVTYNVKDFGEAPGRFGRSLDPCTGLEETFVIKARVSLKLPRSLKTAVED